MNNLLIVDVSGFVYRNHFAFSKRITNGGSFGALRTILKIIDELKINGIVFAFDSRRETLKRNNISKDYKQNRKPTPSGVIEQIHTFQTITHKLGITALKIDGYEADDLIATAIKLLEDQYDKIYVATSDKDLQQVLLNDKISIIYDGKLDRIINRSDFITTNDLLPEQIPDFFGLIGDTSDNIPGVKGIGYHTARKLIKEYHTLENILKVDKPNEHITEHTIKLLQEHKKDAITSKELATLIYCDKIKSLNADYSKEKWGDVFKEYDFKSLMKYTKPNEVVYIKQYLLDENQLKALGIDPIELKLEEYIIEEE